MIQIISSYLLSFIIQKMKITALEEDELESNLIQKGKNKTTGATFYLDPTYLPALSNYILQNLSPQEKSCLNQFTFQNLLIELTYNRPKKVNEISALKDFIISELKFREIYWITGSQIHQQLTQDKNQIDQQYLNMFIKYKNQIDQMQSIVQTYEFVNEKQHINQEEKFKGVEMLITTFQNQEYDSFIKRQTRGQRNKTVEDEPKEEKIVTEFSQNPFYPFNNKKFNRIEYQLFPYIYQFICAKKSILPEKQFKLQNFILFLLMTETPEVKHKINNQFLKTPNEEDFQNLTQIQQDQAQIQQNHLPEQPNNLVTFYSQYPLLKSFDEYCLQNVLFYIQNLILGKILPIDLQTLRKRLTLISNTLSLCFCYLVMKPESIPDNNNPLPFLLQRPDLSTPSTQIIALGVGYYVKNIEGKNYNPEAYHIYQKLREYQMIYENPGCQKSPDEIQSVIDSYNNLILAPDMVEKRQYQFHSSDRVEWTETQYHTFLKGLEFHFNVAINNKLIAKYIGPDVLPNHVRYIKGNYLRSIKKRARDLKKSLKEVLQYDIANFQIEMVKL